MLPSVILNLKKRFSLKLDFKKVYQKKTIKGEIFSDHTD